MNCLIYEMPQRSPEWFEARKGKLTASNFGPWLVKSDATSKAAREKAICKLIAERAGCESPPNFENWAMQRGTELEPQAVAAFESETGLKVREVGFCASMYGAFGCSPDGLIGQDSGFEGKVPVPETHVRYRRAGVLPPEYIWQVHGCMAVTGAKSWHFQSWNPGLVPLQVEVNRDDFTEKLHDALCSFAEEYEKAWDEEREAYLAWKETRKDR